MPHPLGRAVIVSITISSSSGTRAVVVIIRGSAQVYLIRASGNTSYSSYLSSIADSREDRCFWPQYNNDYLGSRQVQPTVPYALVVKAKGARKTRWIGTKQPGTQSQLQIKG